MHDLIWKSRIFTRIRTKYINKYTIIGNETWYYGYDTQISLQSLKKYTLKMNQNRKSHAKFFLKPKSVFFDCAGIVCEGMRQLITDIRVSIGISSHSDRIPNRPLTNKCPSCWFEPMTFVAYSMHYRCTMDTHCNLTMSADRLTYISHCALGISIPSLWSVSVRIFVGKYQIYGKQSWGKHKYHCMKIGFTTGKLKF